MLQQARYDHAASTLLISTKPTTRISIVLDGTEYQKTDTNETMIREQGLSGIIIDYSGIGNYESRCTEPVLVNKAVIVRRE